LIQKKPAISAGFFCFGCAHKSAGMNVAAADDPGFTVLFHGFSPWEK
jgi:hypothetical protein